MKKKLLFVIDSLMIGGAEKSLVSLLNMINPTKYEIDIMLFKHGGDLEKHVPRYINILPPLAYFKFLNNEKLWISKNILFLYYRYKTSIDLRINNHKKNILHSEQVVYRSVEEIIKPSFSKEYDVAIAYSQGMPTYFVANKVVASKKLAWINTDYINTLYDKEFDYQSYKKIDKIVTVSQYTKESVTQIREEYKSKVEIMFDILDSNTIKNMAVEHEVDEFDKKIVNILTVGRLATVKAYNKAIRVATRLKHSGCKFKWYIIGEGPERKNLQELIDKYQLKDYFFLLGKKLNPYPYMKQCDIYVQTSIKEGFGLTVCEAKILKKLIVCTNFPTAKEIINHEVDGLIVEHNIDSIYSGIKKYLEDSEFQKYINVNLNSLEPYNSKRQILKFYQLIEN